MNPSRNQTRKSRGQSFAPEQLECRQVMSVGMGSTFAIMPGTVGSPGKPSSIQFKIDPNYFTGAKNGKITLGFDVASASSTSSTSSFAPQIVSIKDSSGRGIAIQHSRYSPTLMKANKLTNPNSTAVTASFPAPKAGQPAKDYTITVRGTGSQTGGYLVGFYLPGDAAGNGVVDSASIQTIQGKRAATSTSSTYSFDADVDRDGKISNSDLKLAQKNIGAKTTVSPIISVNLDPATDGPGHARVTNHQTVRFTGATTPNAAITFVEINNNSPGATTTADASGNYSAMVPLGNGANTFKVTTKDGFGQVISGSISPVTYTTDTAALNAPPATTTGTTQTT